VEEREGKKEEKGNTLGGGEDDGSGARSLCVDDGAGEIVRDPIEIEQHDLTCPIGTETEEIRSGTGERRRGGEKERGEQERMK